MPSGHNEDEVLWYRGWYDAVVKPAVTDAGYEPKLSLLEERPTPINDEIRSHLAYDPMVVVDLGSISPDAEPNPNVMYELGIRHALDMPVVMLAWKGQRLPFDVAHQRVIMENRRMVDLGVNREKLVAFIGAAATGHYYRPMQAVGRVAALEAASTSLGPESVLGALVKEVRDLRTVVSTLRESDPKFAMARLIAPAPPAGKMARRAFRARHWAAFEAAGGDNDLWNGFVGPLLSGSKFMEVAEGWGIADWKQYVDASLEQQAARRRAKAAITANSVLGDDGLGTTYSNGTESSSAQ
jgi:hypothetical protein